MAPPSFTGQTVAHTPHPMQSRNPVYLHFALKTLLATLLCYVFYTAADWQGIHAVLTRYGQRLIQLYDLLAQIQQKAFDVLSDDDALPLNSLLAAISRFSLQTSARNQWFGTITARDRNQVQQHVDVLLADGETRLKVAITAQSGERLGLDEGKEVLVLLKAPWVGITQDDAIAQAADNQLQGIINHIERGTEQCEVLMALPDGQTLCATVPLDAAATLTEGTNVTAYFNADRVIIATLC